MRRLKTFLFLLVFFIICQNESPAQHNVVYKLRDVKTVYLDEDSFKFSSSSCMKSYGNLSVVCSKHWESRAAFLVALKRWLGKYNFVLTADKQSADAVLQGDLSIDDDYSTEMFNERERKRKKDAKNGKKDEYESPSMFPNGMLPGEPVWTVRGWLINQNGNKLWTSPFTEPPGSITYTGKPSKIEGKRLANKLRYDFKKSK